MQYQDSGFVDSVGSSYAYLSFLGRLHLRRMHNPTTTHVHISTMNAEAAAGTTISRNWVSSADGGVDVGVSVETVVETPHPISTSVKFKFIGGDVCEVVTTATVVLSSVSTSVGLVAGSVWDDVEA